MPLRLRPSRCWPGGGSATSALSGMRSTRRCGSLVMTTVATVSADGASWVAYVGVVGAHTTTRRSRPLLCVVQWALESTCTMRSSQRRGALAASRAPSPTALGSPWLPRASVLAQWPACVAVHGYAAETSAVRLGQVATGAGTSSRSSAVAWSRTWRHACGIQASTHTGSTRADA